MGMPGAPTWAIVANRATARILRGLEAPDTNGAPPGELVHRARSARLAARLSEASAQPPSRAETGAMASDLRDFAHEIAQLLDVHRLAGDVERIALWAPRAVLDSILAAMSAPLRAAVFLTGERDLTALSETALRACVRDEIAAAEAGLPATNNGRAG
jgi:hypothetical protein